MIDNIYATPNSDLENNTGENSENTITAEFYVVSIRKFSILFLSTMGIYSIYWFYRNFKQQKIVTGNSSWPIARAIFNIFFTHSLTSKIDEILSLNDVEHKWSPANLATAIVILNIISNLTGKSYDNATAEMITTWASLALVPLIYYPTLAVQKAANKASLDEFGVANQNLTIGNIAWCVVGGLLWMLIVASVGIEIFYPEFFYE